MLLGALVVVELKVWCDVGLRRSAVFAQLSKALLCFLLLRVIVCCGPHAGACSCCAMRCTWLVRLWVCMPVSSRNCRRRWKTVVLLGWLICGLLGAMPENATCSLCVHIVLWLPVFPALWNNFSCSLCNCDGLFCWLHAARLREWLRDAAVFWERACCHQ